jgi:glycyl-tRNA synthetase beta chain
MADFLLEIGCEEIPARMLDKACEEIGRLGSLLLSENLLSDADVKEESFEPEGKEVVPGLRVLKTSSAFGPIGKTYATPRRVAYFQTGILQKQPDKQEKQFGPAVKVAFKDGKPTAAAEAFAKKLGLSVDQLNKETTPKGDYLSAVVSKKGRYAREILAERLPKEIAAIYWPKSMYWRPGKPERFVRPVRWIVAMLDGEVIPLEFAGVRASAETCGHRVLGSWTVLRAPKDYEAALEEKKVVVDSRAREERIRKALDAAARTVPNVRWREDKELLDTVVNLTEWPSAILGSFDKSYLDLPEEVLVTVMRDHQKYFAVEDANGKLAPHFLAVLNTDGDPDGLIRHGNERVLRARFNDARFFWQTDQKIRLNERVNMLHAVTFQKDLGNYHAKAGRVANLSSGIATELADAGVKIDRDALNKAAWLAKTDLTTELVKEFTELQGIIGGLYANAQHHGPHIADAIYDQYKPEAVEDSAPRTIEGAVLSIADKADSIAGMFALGNIPTGSKDPFALRRQANGIIKTIAEHKLRMRLSGLLLEAVNSYKSSPGKLQEFFTGAPQDKVTEWVNTFFRERLEFYLREARGFAYDVVNAVLAAGADDVVDTVARAEAVSAVRNSEDFEAISVSFKRMKNILRQAREAKHAPAPEFAPTMAREKEEITLAGEMPHVAGTADRMRTEGKYREALAEVSKLRPYIDAFFDKVMVMDPDERIRANRLALLSKLLQDFSTVAEFSEIVTEKK